MVVGLLTLVTIIVSIVVAVDGSLLNGILFGLGFFVATGAGAVLRRQIRGTLKSPVPMYILTAAVLLLAYWLGSHGYAALTIAGTQIFIDGGFWAAICGPLAGMLMAEPEEKSAARAL